MSADLRFRCDFLRPLPAPGFMRRRLHGLALGFALVAASWFGTELAQARSDTPAAGTPQLSLPRLQLQSGMYRIDAQVASTPAQRQIGLMHRTHMPEHEGMLFVFERPATQCFWMRNTLLPLTAAFLDDQGRIVNLADMAPQTDTQHCSAQPVRYVLEMNQGWFAKRRLQAGSVIKGLPKP